MKITAQNKLYPINQHIRNPNSFAYWALIGLLMLGNAEL